MSTVVVDYQQGPSTSVPDDRPVISGQQSAAAERVEEIQNRQNVCDDKRRKKTPTGVTKHLHKRTHIDDDVYRRALRTNRSKLIDKLYVSVKFLNQLVDAKVITEDQFHRLKEKPVGTSQIDALLDILERQPKHTFPMFLQVLSDSDQHHVVSMLKSSRQGTAAGNDYVEEPLSEAGSFHAGALSSQGPSSNSTYSDYRNSAISDQSDVTSTTGSISLPLARNGSIAKRVKMLEEALKKQYDVDSTSHRNVTEDRRSVPPTAGYRPPKNDLDHERRPRHPESRHVCDDYAVKFGHNQRSVIRRAVVEFRGPSDDEYTDYEDDVNINRKRCDRMASIGRKRRQAHYPMTSRWDSGRSKRSSAVHQYQPLSSKTEQAGNVQSDLLIAVMELKSFLGERIDCCEQKLDELKEIVLQLQAANVTRTAYSDDDVYTTIATDSSAYDIVSFPMEDAAANKPSEGSHVAVQQVNGFAQTAANVEMTRSVNVSRNACEKIGAHHQSVPHLEESKERPALPGIRGPVCDRRLTTNKTNSQRVPGKMHGAEEHKMTDIRSELQKAIKLNKERRQNVAEDQRAGNESQELHPAATNLQPDQLTAVQLEAAALRETNRVKQFVMQLDPTRIQMLRKPASTTPVVQPDSVHGSSPSPESQQTQKMSCKTNQSTLLAVSGTRSKTTDSALGCWDRQGKPTGRTTQEAVLKVKNTSSTTVGLGQCVPTSGTIHSSCAKPHAAESQINSAPVRSPSQTVMSSDPDISHCGDGANSGSRPLVWAVTGQTVNTRASIFPGD